MEGRGEGSFLLYFLEECSLLFLFSNLKLGHSADIRTLENLRTWSECRMALIAMS